MPIDEWRTAAETEDALVAELLLRIKHSGETWMKKDIDSADPSSGGLTAVRWGRRKARTRPGVTRFVIMNKQQESKERATRSPTTVLSWSGGGGGGTSVSGSGNGDGFEASSTMTCFRSSVSRSMDNDLSNSKRSKREKTYSELKEEEGSLLQERQILKRDLATLRLTLTNHRTTNENLKRIKSMNVQLRRIAATSTSAMVEGQFVSFPKQPKTTSMQGLPLVFPPHDSNNAISPQVPPQTSFSSDPFMLPDLNMVPSIDEECF